MKDPRADCTPDGGRDHGLDGDLGRGLDGGGDPGRGLGEVAKLFLKLGVVAFGGPAAHIAMLEDEVVTRRAWMSRQHFLDLVGATNLIPGPNSTEMTMHVGYERAGWPGLFTAGACFIGPAVLLTGLAAWAYVRFGTLPAVEPLLYGIKPAVLAVILGALWKLGRTAVDGWELAVLGSVVGLAVWFGAGEVPALLGGGLVGMLWLRIVRRSSETADRWFPVLFLTVAGQGTGALAAQTAATGGSGTPAVVGISLWKLGLFFLKIGAILYGSGYVLVAFLEGGLVDQLGWLTRAELLDAIAIGQFTPGPVLSTATFIGYLIEGIPGAAVATVGIFLPSFIFVLILNPLIPRLRGSAWLSAFLDAVNVAAVALMAVVLVRLASEVLVDRATWLIALAAAGLVLRYRVNAVWLVLGGALVGYLMRVLA